MNWVNPESLLSMRDEVSGLIGASSLQVHASEAESIEQKEDLETVKSKLENSDPSMIYNRSYDMKGVLGNIDTQSQKATFSLTPYENRIIIPRIGKNIPLVDVE